MRPRHIALAGSLLVALVAINPGKAGALPTAPAGSVYGIQSDVVQVHSRGLKNKKQYRRHYRRYKYHRRYYPRYRYRRYHRRHYYPYYYYPYYGYPYYYRRPGISLYFSF